MTTVKKTGISRYSRWGWGILFLVSAFLVLNGVGWFFMGPSLSTFGLFYLLLGAVALAGQLLARR